MDCIRKKIGIVTLTGSDNYGNVLQNYAVQEIIESLGYSSETIVNTTSHGHVKELEKVNKYSISYAIKVIRSRLNYGYNIKNSGKGIVKTLCFYKRNTEKNREENFQCFTGNFIHWAERTLDINAPWTKEEINQYFMYVSGSDQVWNPTYPSTSSINFLQFAPRTKRMTLSPSFGVSVLPNNIKDDYARWLGEIDYLSVREERGAELIKELCGRDAVVLCDPTMAVSVEKWISLEKRPTYLGSKPYILTYFLGDRTKEYDDYIEKIAQDNNLEIIHLYDILDLRAYATSPQELIYLIHNAKLVCTDSFHGAVFSILLHTNFVTFHRNETGSSMESRLATLLDTYHLQNRDYKKLKGEDVFKTNFSDADKTLEKKRQQLMKFVSDALNHDNEDLICLDSVYDEKSSCCGCRACEMICPKHCIAMREDGEGFLYPEIDTQKCIHCNLCRNVCPIKVSKKATETNVESYIGYSLNSDTRKKSSSGGVFSEIATEVLSKNGILYGPGFDDSYVVKHMRITNLGELHKLRGSKYVQSDISTTFVEVKQDLEEGKIVLFSGTPCQIKGLYTYLKKDYDNLITQDIVCHGVPSPKVWRQYIRSFPGVERVSFRSKRYGWHYFSMLIEYKNGKHIKRLDEDTYLRLFLDNVILRPICYQCSIKREGSCADITLADCWSLDSITNQVKDTDEGLSLVFVRTNKAQELLNDKKVHLVKVDSQKAINSQLMFNASVKPNSKRALFFDNVDKGIINNWYNDSLIRKIKRRYVFAKTKVYNIINTFGIDKYLCNKH